MPILNILTDARGERQRSFLVIGGFAVNAHGFARQTFDLDILVSRSDRDFWEQLITENGFCRRSRNGNFSQFTATTPGALPLDVMVVNDQTYSKMFAAAVAGSVNGVTVRHPSLWHLLALKLHVLKLCLPHRELRDLYDVIQLVEINRVDTSTPEFRELCARFGNAKTYEAIIRRPKQ